MVKHINACSKSGGYLVRCSKKQMQQHVTTWTQWRNDKSVTGPHPYRSCLGFVYISSRQTHVLEQGRDPVQLQHMLFPHVAFELLHTLMRL